MAEGKQVGHPPLLGLENEVDRVDVLYGLGVRAMGITYSESNALGSGLKEPTDGGLTTFGRQVVRRMNRIGKTIQIGFAANPGGIAASYVAGKAASWLWSYCTGSSSAQSLKSPLALAAPLADAGGSKAGDREMFEAIEGAMKAGAKGLSIGRNAFQHKNPTLFVKAACAMVHDGITADEAMAMLEQKK